MQRVFIFCDGTGKPKLGLKPDHKAGHTNTNDRGAR